MTFKLARVSAVGRTTRRFLRTSQEVIAPIVHKAGLNGIEWGVDFGARSRRAAFVTATTEWQ